MNKVIAGNYEGNSVKYSFGKVKITSFGSSVSIDSSTVEKYEIVNQDSIKSGASAFGRAIVGDVLFGGLGLVAGALSAKNKQTMLVAIEFKSGNKSLIEIDGDIYKALTKALFTFNGKQEKVEKVDKATKAKNDANYKAMVVRVKEEKKLEKLNQKSEVR